MLQLVCLYYFYERLRSNRKIARTENKRGRRAELSGSVAAGCGQPPLLLKYVRICSKTFTSYDKFGAKKVKG